MAGRGFAGYLASVRSDEHECACSHIRRRHALIYGPRRSRYGGVCTACPCERFTPRPPVERATWRMSTMIGRLLCRIGLHRWYPASLAVLGCQRTGCDVWDIDWKNRR